LLPPRGSGSASLGKILYLICVEPASVGITQAAAGRRAYRIAGIEEHAVDATLDGARKFLESLPVIDEEER
jgi:hypothetical protein